MTKTTISKVQAKSGKKWYLIDANGQTLGHLAARIAVLLRGKGKATYTPHADMGDYVVVINIEKIRVTGGKEHEKEYFHHTRYPAGLRRQVLADLRQKNPAKILHDAVAGMLPRNRTKRTIMERLKIYAGEEHGHAAQKPEPITL